MSPRVGLLTILGIIVLIFALVGPFNATYAGVAIALVAFVSAWAP